LHFGKVLTGSHGGDGKPHLDIPRYHNLFCLERIKLREFITDKFTLGEINQAIQQMQDGIISGRCMILLSQD